jgi:tetratricopeptide (TPR) repeat protein
MFTFTTAPMRVSYDERSDGLRLCEYGIVGEERMSDQTAEVGDQLRFLLSADRSRAVGVRVARVSTIDLDAHEPDLWEEPRLRIPSFGLHRVPLGEAIARARTLCAGRSTIDVQLTRIGHEQLADGRLEDAARTFAQSIDAGELRGHLRLARVESALDRHRSAYDHARIYTELAPRDSRGWAALGLACLTLGEPEEGRSALRRAVELQSEGSYRTPAARALRRF